MHRTPAEHIFLSLPRVPPWNPGVNSSAGMRGGAAFDGNDDDDDDNDVPVMRQRQQGWRPLMQDRGSKERKEQEEGARKISFEVQTNEGERTAAAAEVLGQTSNQVTRFTEASSLSPRFAVERQQQQQQQRLQTTTEKGTSSSSTDSSIILSSSASYFASIKPLLDSLLLATRNTSTPRTLLPSS